MDDGVTPRAEQSSEQEQTVRIEWRGRDIALVPPAALWPLDDPALYTALFGKAAGQVSARLRRDQRAHILRARPIDFTRLKAALAGWQVTVNFEERPPLPWPVHVTLTPRPYQEDALTAWRAEGCRGVVVLPTGSGKTLVGALALAEVELATLVVVPTIDLLRQWQRALAEALGQPAEALGVYGGGAHEVQPITIITYESAAIHPELLRRFGLLIFDECHHLPAQTYRQIAEGASTPLRLGLSATPERADEEHLALDYLIGPEVYRRAPDELAAARYLASYDERQLNVGLSPQDAVRYDEARAIYSSYLRQRHIVITSPADFQRKVLWASARDPEARAAMLAWREARSLAMNAPAKFALLEELFAQHPGERVLVFSEYNALVDAVSQRFCIPQITHKTATEERRLILERFRAGRYLRLVTGRVLNEGVDIPDCGVAIIVSGNATRREYIQRLGRVLRPKETRAVLYELVTEGTTEEHVSDRRRSRG